MASMWAACAWVLLPVAIALLVIIMIPLPAFLDNFVLQVVKYAFHIRVPFFGLEWFYTVLVGSGVLCAMKLQSLLATDKNENSINGIQLKASRWRKERNFWISATTFVIYFMLWRYYALKLEVKKLKEKSKEKSN